MKTKTKEKKKYRTPSLLVVSAHPDDDCLVAGTMKKFSKAGFPVHEFCCTNAGNGKNNEDEKDQDDQKKKRKQELNKFAKLIGCTEPVIYGDREPCIVEPDMVYALAKYMREVQPTVIIVLNEHDYHFSHRLSRETALLAFEMAYRSAYDDLGPVLKGAVVLETDGLNLLAEPNIFFNISDTFKDKKNALIKAYNERLGSDLLVFVESLAKVRGGRVGHEYAECFQPAYVKSFRFDSASSHSLDQFIQLGS